MKVKSLLLKTHALFCAIILLAVMCPIKIKNTYASSVITQKIGCTGGEFNYYSQIATSYKCNVYWIDIKRTGRDKFNIKVAPSNEKVYSYNWDRRAYIDFYDQKGRVLQTYCVLQENRYIYAISNGSTQNISINKFNSNSGSFIFCYNCPFFIQYSQDGRAASEYGIYNASSVWLKNGGSYCGYGSGRSSYVYIHTYNGANTTGKTKKATIKFNDSYGHTSQTINVTQESVFSNSNKFTHDDRYIETGLPTNGNIELCDASLYKLNSLNRFSKDRVKIVYDSTPRSGAASGYIYGAYNIDGLMDDLDHYQILLGRFVITKEGNMNVEWLKGSYVGLDPEDSEMENSETKWNNVKKETYTLS